MRSINLSRADAEKFIELAERHCADDLEMMMLAADLRKLWGMPPRRDGGFISDAEILQLAEVILGDVMEIGPKEVLAFARTVLVAR